MKKVSGKLKLMLATYREMAAFAQFASDLDDSTKSVLERGKRMVELLKQGVNAPIPFEKQVVTIYAGINGYLDKLPLEHILPFEQTLYQKLDTVSKDLLEKIVAEKNLTEEIEAQIKQVIEAAVAETNVG